MAASKFLHDTDSDDSMCNQTWALNFDYEVKDLNNLELGFYSSLGWNLFVSKSEFEGFIANTFIFPLNSNGTGRNKPGRHSHITAKRISEIRVNRKIIDASFKWPMAKVSCRIKRASFCKLFVYNECISFFPGNDCSCGCIPRDLAF